jgi:hypothetical protein
MKNELFALEHFWVKNLSDLHLLLYLIEFISFTK